MNLGWSCGKKGFGMSLSRRIFFDNSQIFWHKGYFDVNIRFSDRRNSRWIRVHDFRVPWNPIRHKIIFDPYQWVKSKVDGSKDSKWSSMSTCGQRIVYFDPWPSTLKQTTVQYGSRPSTFERTVHLHPFGPFTLDLPLTKSFMIVMNNLVTSGGVWND